MEKSTSGTAGQKPCVSRKARETLDKQGRKLMTEVKLHAVRGDLTPGSGLGILSGNG